MPSITIKMTRGVEKGSRLHRRQCVINGVLRRRSRGGPRSKTNFQINGGRSSLIASSGPGWASYGRPQRL